MISSDCKQRKRLLVHATNVHHGGGRTLLDALLKLPLKPGTMALLDARMPLSHAMPTTTVVSVRPSVLGRLNAERQLRALARPDDVILCFGNLPPLFDVAGHVVVFVQNRFLIDDVSLANLPFWQGLRLRIERAWFRARAKAAHTFVVQTPSMKSALERHLASTKTKPRFIIKIQPYASFGAPPPLSSAQEPYVGGAGYDFVYVASGEHHKNHRRLIEAWILLANEGCRPSLALTVDSAAYSDLCDWIEVQKQTHGLRIENKSLVPTSQVIDLYKCSGALIYPSTLESFGLPLIEARHAGLAVLAGELDFVRDVLNPEETFDPSSAVSIARAVKRFRRMEEPSLKIVDASTFVASLELD